MTNSTPVLGVAMLAHLVMLSMWGGVVATEAVIEIFAFRRRELAGAAIRLHFWIDLVVELPIVVAVAGTGITGACLLDHLTRWHVVKLGFAATEVGVDLFCIAVVLRRDRQRLADADTERLRTTSRVVLACFAVGLPCAGVAAVLGYSLASSRMR